MTGYLIGGFAGRRRTLFTLPAPGVVPSSCAPGIIRAGVRRVAALYVLGNHGFLSGRVLDRYRSRGDRCRPGFRHSVGGFSLPAGHEYRIDDDSGRPRIMAADADCGTAGLVLVLLGFGALAGVLVTLVCFGGWNRVGFRR
jgi:hypothetical protein